MKMKFTLDKLNKETAIMETIFYDLISKTKKEKEMQG